MKDLRILQGWKLVFEVKDTLEDGTVYSYERFEPVFSAIDEAEKPFLLALSNEGTFYPILKTSSACRLSIPDKAGVNITLFSLSK